MAAISSFERRMDDMYNASTPATLKRKSLNNYSTPSRSRQNGRETVFLEPVQKRMKSAQSFILPPLNTRTSLFPNAVQPALNSYNRNNGFYPAPRVSHYFSQPVPSPSWPPCKATIREVESPVVHEYAGSAYSEPPLVPVPSSTVEESVESALRAEREINNALLDAKNMEIAAIREMYEREKKIKLEVMEAVERALADQLKGALEPETFRKLLLEEQSGSSSTLIEARLAQEYRDTRDSSKAFSFPRREHLRSMPKMSSRASDMSSGGSLSDEEDESGKNVRDGNPNWKELLSKVNDPVKTERRSSLQKQIAYETARFEALQLDRSSKFKAEKKPEVDPKLVDAFTPLSDEDEKKVDEALRGTESYQVLHEKSNIEVTRGVMQCLLPGAWLNDEVINVYMELLKERELREPDRFIKCHFFNTFFYNKLFKDKRSYDYKAIRRWTTQKKLGYSLNDCDKILVPIHQDIHWCLAVINIRDKKLEYLDSLKGRDFAVLDVLARYIADEAKDKDGRVLDTASWEHDFPQEIPEQLNGCDCGMFMVKYADFHSRDASLHFAQEHMEYFRRKMVWEILNLQAT